VWCGTSETTGTFLTNWTILLQYFYGLMPLQQLMRKYPSDARSLPVGITASAVSHSIRRFRVKTERDRRLMKRLRKQERLKLSKIITLLFFSSQTQSCVISICCGNLFFDTQAPFWYSSFLKKQALINLIDFKIIRKDINNEDF